MKLYLAANNRTCEQGDRARQLTAFLEQRLGAEVSMSEESSLAFFGNTGHVTFGAADGDAVLSLGGDGAFLRAALTASEADKPLLGINSGRLGYLCSVRFDDLDSLTEGGFEGLLETSRSLLAIRGCSRAAVNDVYILKNNPAEAIDIEIDYGRKGHMRFRGDGVIICTPTGSSAYNRSAGGPIIDGESAVFCITPICAHLSEAGSVVVSNEVEIRIRIHRAESGASAYMDGTCVSR